MKNLRKRLGTNAGVLILAACCFLIGCAQTPHRQTGTGFPVRVGIQDANGLPVELQMDKPLPVEARLQIDERMPVELVVEEKKSLPVELQIAVIYAGVNGFLDDVSIDAIGQWEKDYSAFLNEHHSDLLADIKEKRQIDDTVKSRLEKAIAAFKEKRK